VAASVGCKRLLFTSSGAVYGGQPPEMTHLSEAYRGGPDVSDARNAYAESKRLAEVACAAHDLARTAAIVTARGFAFVGPRLPLDIHFAAGNFVRDALERDRIVLEGDGSPYRSYLYAADLAAWLWVLLVSGAAGRAYNVGSEDSRTLRDTATVVGALGGKPVEVRRAPVPGAPASRYVPSTARARAELGLEQRIPLDDAFRRTIAYYAAAR
jgi:dTDP-glucose 4,6-dehydratase